MSRFWENRGTITGISDQKIVEYYRLIEKKKEADEKAIRQHETTILELENDLKTMDPKSDRAKELSTLLRSMKKKDPLHAINNQFLRSAAKILGKFGYIPQKTSDRTMSDVLEKGEKYFSPIGSRRYLLQDLSEHRKEILAQPDSRGARALKAVFRGKPNEELKESLCNDLNDNLYKKELLGLANELDLPVTKSMSKAEICGKISEYMNKWIITLEDQTTILPLHEASIAFKKAMLPFSTPLFHRMAAHYWSTLDLITWREFLYGPKGAIDLPGTLGYNVENQDLIMVLMEIRDEHVVIREPFEIFRNEILGLHHSIINGTFNLQDFVISDDYCLLTYDSEYCKDRIRQKHIRDLEMQELASKRSYDSGLDPSEDEINLIRLRAGSFSPTDTNDVIELRNEVEKYVRNEKLRVHMARGFALSKDEIEQIRKNQVKILLKSEKLLKRAKS